MLISIDYSKPKLQAVKIERQELLPGPEGVAVCTWADGSTYKSGIANLQLESRASAKVIPPKPKAKGKVKARGKDKTKRKAKAKGRPRKGAARPAEEELPDGAAEDVPAVVEPPAAAEDLHVQTHAHTGTSM